jgi:hypothetical protein
VVEPLVHLDVDPPPSKGDRGGQAAMPAPTTTTRRTSLSFSLRVTPLG